ncbi:MAG TPA: hypothetical protein VM390_07120, partial [Acidimicrobiales bacterium]|nr:hypothetical protein [Acidimicrobiales bacterium]
MATRTPPKAKAKPKSTAKPKAKIKPAAAAAGRRPKLPGPKPPARKPSAAARRSSAGSGHGQDLVGLALAAAGLLAALAVYWDLAGPAGRALRDGAAAAFGVGRFAVPVVVLGAGGLVLWRRPLCDPARLGAGLAVVVVTVCGLLHLLRDGPE